MDLFTTVAFVGAFMYLIKILKKAYISPTSSIPGPFLARFTKLWELNEAVKGSFEKKNLALHRKYGRIVRIAPSTFSINDPAAVKEIYSAGTKFVKSDFYHAFGSPDPEQGDLFSERDSKRHSLKRRKVASLYSMTTLISYEKFVDRCNQELCSKFEEFSDDGRAFELPAWMQFYAFDVIGEITTGEPFGFMRQGYDFNGILDAIDQSMIYGSRIGIFPELHGLLAGIMRAANQRIPFDTIADYIRHHIGRRNTQGNFDAAAQQDFLTKLLSLQEAQKIDALDTFTTMGANIAAGSDTTAISLTTVIYALIKNPSAAQKLREEVDFFEAEGKLSDPVTFKQAQNMPYLQACIKEALRIHPATGRPLVRKVPVEGATLAGQFFPGGSSVGANPWVIHFNEEIFGPDAMLFRPERWLHNKEKLSLMEQNFLSFGWGARSCIGKNISLLEISKLIPQLYRRFDFISAEPGAEWETSTHWFVKQKFICLVKPRT
ncbi:cytochrome protein [Penicillium odoratum]|uniref:cytochrome protein n=1 Tax=Penicillium odoratum TaxID=1167516 RepID=UPI00254888FD|nr:cytochrome protein [Penicillium odoratum]KAJ5745727.1 cytochrome protein [Penicillium odoratum]